MRLSQRERDEIVEAYQSGEGSTAVGRRYGITPQHVAMIVKRAGKPALRKAKPMKPEVARIIVRLPKHIETALPMIVTPQHVGSGRHSSVGYLKLI